VAIPSGTVRTSHVLKLRADGVTIGLVQNWSPSQARNVTPAYEINSITKGDVHENIPGPSSGLTIQVSRVDLYEKRMEQAWGPNFNVQMLIDQTRPLSIQERWEDPLEPPSHNEDGFSSSVKDAWSTFKSGVQGIGGVFASDFDEFMQLGKKNSRKHVNIYTGVWFTSLGRGISANDSRIVFVNATLVYRRVYRAL